MALLRKQPLFDWRSYAQGRLATGREILLLQKATGQGIRYVELEEKSVRSIGPLPLCEWTATGRSWHRCFCRQPGKSHEAGVYAPFPFRVTGRHRHPTKGNGREAARFRMLCSASSQILERVTFSAAALNIQFRGSCYAPGVCLVEGRCRTCCLTRRRGHIKRTTCIVCGFSTSIPVRLLRISSTM